MARAIYLHILYMSFLEIHRILDIDGHEGRGSGSFSPRAVAWIKRLYERLQHVSTRLPRASLTPAPTPSFKQFSIPPPLLSQMSETSYRTFEGHAVMPSGRKVHVSLSKLQRAGIAQFRHDLRLILLVLALLDDVARSSCSSELHVHIIYTPFKKTMNDVVFQLEQQHVNSAYTYSCTRNNDIVIYREEEWFKVFIHECFHALGLDFSTMNQDGVQASLKTMFKGLDPRISNVRAYEAYAETWAEWLNLVLQVFLERHQRANAFVQELRRRVFYEKAWTAYQCMKVLHHYRTSYHGLVSGTGTVAYQEEHTHVFAYHVLKAVLFIHLDEFLVWCMETTGSNDLSCAQFPQSAVPKFVAFVRQHYTSACMDSWLSRVHLHRASPESRASMRMTLAKN